MLPVPTAAAPPAAPLPPPNPKLPPPNPSRWAIAAAGPSAGTRAANCRLVLRSSVRNALQPAQSCICRRATPFGRSRRSWARISSSRISAQSVSRASAAWARLTRERTSNDLIAGTETPIAAAMSL